MLKYSHNFKLNATFLLMHHSKKQKELILE